jgi:hypothetical protein
VVGCMAVLCDGIRAATDFMVSSGNRPFATDPQCCGKMYGDADKRRRRTPESHAIGSHAYWLEAKHACVTSSLGVVTEFMVGAVIGLKPSMR